MKDNMTTEIRQYITDKLNSLYDVYTNDVISDEQLNVVVALIEQFESMADFVGGVKFKERKQDRELGNIVRASR
jgi:hypothetical protein